MLWNFLTSFSRPEGAAAVHSRLCRGAVFLPFPAIAQNALFDFLLITWLTNSFEQCARSLRLQTAGVGPHQPRRFLRRIIPAQGPPGSEPSPREDFPPLRIPWNLRCSCPECPKIIRLSPRIMPYQILFRTSPGRICSFPCTQPFPNTVSCGEGITHTPPIISE